MQTGGKAKRVAWRGREPEFAVWQIAMEIMAAGGRKSLTRTEAIGMENGWRFCTARYICLPVECKEYLPPRGGGAVFPLGAHVSQIIGDCRRLRIRGQGTRRAGASPVRCCRDRNFDGFSTNWSCRQQHVLSTLSVLGLALNWFHGHNGTYHGAPGRILRRFLIIVCS